MTTKKQIVVVEKWYWRWIWVVWPIAIGLLVLYLKYKS